MGSWLFWGIVLLGGVLVGLGLAQMVRRKNAASTSSKQIHRINSITDSMQVKRIRKPPSVNQNADLGPPPNREDWDEVELSRSPHPQKSEVSRSGSFPPPVDPAAPPVIVRGRNYSQKVVPGAKQTQNPQPRYKHPENVQPNPSSSNEIDPAFEQTQIRQAPRRKFPHNHSTVVSNLQSDNDAKRPDIRIQAINNPSTAYPTQQPDSMEDQTAIRRPPRLTKPSPSSDFKDLPN